MLAVTVIFTGQDALGTSASDTFERNLTGNDKENEDSDICGPALTNRFKPLFPLLGQDVKTDDAALKAAAAFLSIVGRAYDEWDEIVISE